MSRISSLIVLVLTLSCPLRADEPVLRYQLSPGQRLSYVTEMTSQSYTMLVRAELWVLGQTDDGRWDVLMRQTRQMVYKNASPREPDNLGLLRFTLSPDGTIPADEAGGFQLNPREYFPKLPEQGKTGWEYNDTVRENILRFKILPEEEPGVTRIDVQTQNVMDEVYGVTRTQTLHFDRAKGLLIRSDSKAKQTYGVQEEYRGTTELKAVYELEPEELVGLKRDTEVYLSAKKAYGKATQQAAELDEGIEAALEGAGRALASSKEGVTSPVIMDQIERDLAQHDRYKSYWIESAQRRASVIGQPAADWSLQDLQGNKHALADYRGKVVILDFWYRGCGWCIRAMPQINQVSEDFEGQAVAVLGMNTDDVLDDAVFVEQKMNLRYPNLRAKGIPELYQVRGFPTLIIIDQAGVVREVHVGYSPTLHEEVVETVQGLLAEAPQ